MISKKALWFSLLLLGSTSFALAQTTFHEVAATPYDRQMERIEPTLWAPPNYAIYGPSLNVVNQWMMALRAMPYQYSHDWLKPFEVERARAGDCKGKALLLYGWMRSYGATNLRLVIGKRRIEDSRTHAWLEWNTQAGTLLLDPTFNGAVETKIQDRQTYVAFYGYGGGHKFRASNSLLVNRTLATRNPAAPAHGVITRPTRSTYRSYSSSSSFDRAYIDPRSFRSNSGL